jgi:preprotein translocase subunit SecG
MEIVAGILIAILVIVCILLVLIILMQKSKQEAGLGAAFGGAATEQIFGAGTTSVLTKATIWGTALFFIITLVLAMYYSRGHQKGASGSKVLSNIPTNAVPALISGSATNEAEAAATTATNAAASAATNAPPALTDTNSPATK